MKGDFSRLTFDKKKNYSGVLKQQGRVTVDADWNELIDAIAHQRQVRTIDTIGVCGAPIHSSGFKIRHPGGGFADLLIYPGRFYVDGLLCELHPATKIPIVDFPANTIVEVNELKIDDENIEIDQWVVVFTKETPEGIIARIVDIDTSNKTLELSVDVSALGSQTEPYLRRLILYLEQPDYPGAPDWEPTPGSTDLIYLDVWERHITFIEDPEIREIALGGPDTDTRIQTIAQVKILNIDNNPECPDVIPEWNDRIVPSGARLRTQEQPGTDPTDPCLIGEGGGYRGLENRLYRVEIHEGGDLGIATFKWSRDNGSVAYEIEEFIHDPLDPAGVYKKVRLKQIGKDKVLKIKKDQWLEISGDKTDLDVENSGTIAKVDEEVDEAQTTITLSVDVAAHIGETHPKVRRWDTGTETTTPPTVTTASLINLEDGVQIQFSGSNFKVGDYWVFAARTSTSKVEVLDFEAPRGIKHYYCRLALVKQNMDGSIEIEDCRPEFPPLTELPNRGGCCTVTVGEDGDFVDIQEAVDALEGGPGTVCILPGTYTIDEPITIEGRDITIKGCEGSSLILNSADTHDSGIVFKIQDSWSISISGLMAVTNNGTSVVHSTNSQFVHINNCVMMAGGTSDNAGTVVFQGVSVGSTLEKNLIAGIVGVRFEPLGNIKNHFAARIEQNTIFALQTAIFQNAPLTGFIVKDNLLLGFSTGSLSKTFFPEAFVQFAAKNSMLDKSTISKVKKVQSGKIGFESLTASNTTPVFEFVDNLRAEATIARVSVEEASVAMVGMALPVINLLEFVLDANLLNNTILGRIGIHAAILTESAIERNVIVGSETGISLQSFEGVTIDDNVLTVGSAGVQCQGPLSTNLTVSNNRFLGGTHGFQFLSEGGIFNLIANVQFSQNSITVTKTGIEIDTPASLIYDFTAFDNSIIGCSDYGIILRGLDENLFLSDASFQRVIQRNSIQVQGVGILVAVTDAKIIDNHITINSIPNTNEETYGIKMLANDCTASNNSVHGVVNPGKNILSQGGIYISHNQVPLIRRTVVSANRISGGAGNGIEIDSDFDNVMIDNNMIYDMNLNGIAVSDIVQNTNNLMISNNKIFRCNRDNETGMKWWQNAGIVLKSGEKIQIIGNEICENGRQGITGFQVGGIYAEEVTELMIANNHLIDNGPATGDPTGVDVQAVIHIPAAPGVGNEDVKIVNNLIKGSHARALFLGGEFVCISLGFFTICFGLDEKTVITGNHFESLVTGPAVELQSNLCVFSNNYVECLDSSSSVDLGLGWFVTAIGNVVDEPIGGGGLQVVIEHNVIF